MSTEQELHDREMLIDQQAQRDLDKRVGNSGCIVIKHVRGYGPYAYHVTKTNGKQDWKYLGRADKLGLVTKRVGNSDEEV